MTHNLKPYPAYKPSGVEWLGEVPAHWEVLRARNAVDMRVSNVDKHTKRGELPVQLCNYVDVYKNDKITEHISFMQATASAEEIERFRLEKGDVLLTKDSETWNDIGVPALVEYTAKDIICGYHLALLRPRKGLLNGSYLFRALQCPSIAHQFHVAANGVIRYGLSHSAIKSTLLLIPPLPDQHRIAAFLDQKTAEIDEAISKKQRLIELLKEQKAILINQAVTKGPNPNVPMRDSGVEWIGEVPAHWEVRRNGRLFAQRNETGFADLPILEVSLRTGVRVRDFKNSDRKQLMSDRDKYKRAVSGDIAYNMMRMWQGAVGIAPTDGLISPAYVVAKPLPGTEARYFIHLFRTAAYMTEIDKYSRGIVKDRNRLYWEDFKRMPSCYPPPDEQMLISDAIDDTCDDIAMSAERVRRGIDLLREYRTRLIADVVTGKLDVREDTHRES